MDDDCSIASYEDICSSARRTRFQDHESEQIEMLKALVLESTANGDIGPELSEEEVPDVSYLLQYQEFGGTLIDVRRSNRPININIGGEDESKLPKGQKPVMEIVTVVSTAVISTRPVRNSRQMHVRGRWAPSPVMSGREDDQNSKLAQVKNTAMVIHSAYLLNALRAVVGYYPGTSFIGENARITAPYQVLYHHRDALERYKFAQPKSHDEEYRIVTTKHINILLDFLEKAHGDQIREEEGRHQSSVPAATFERLWMLLKPGEVVYAKYDHKWTPFVISTVIDGSSTHSEQPPGPHTIHCWNIAYASGKLYRSMYNFDIEPFSGEEAISNLPVIPAAFFTGGDGDMQPAEVNAKQVALGKVAWQLSKGPSYMAYDGSLVDKSPEYDWSYQASPTGYMSGRVIVDCEGYHRFSLDCPGRGRGRSRSPPPMNPPPQKDQLPYFAPRCGCNTCSKADHRQNLSSFTGFEERDPTQDDAPKNDLYYLVLSKVVAGFIPGEKRWGHFSVEHLEEIKYDKEAFKYLVLDDEIKTLVRAMVGTFASANGKVSPWPNDFVKNKGQGRIFLLHGSPGVGKTCTAECVAELTHRPLLSLTSGGLSTSGFDVESNLHYFLRLGERFGAMVLIDEADVFLEKRRARDIERNGLVSVFLRALEYYRGALFLTTNRVQAFDSAFTSRIHVALHYKALTDADREKIWLNSFERLERDSGGRVQVSAYTRDYAYQSRDIAGLRWNGREIRNALQTAVAMAETEALEDGQEKVMVNDKHLRSVVKMSRGFKQFLSTRRLREDDELNEEEDVENDEHHKREMGSKIYD
ncbi:P-loop containing nucleoside triphosphate hydrolase protein [Xylariaceae sp. FL0016]|nr:P-loop containing nucleoside triphosphate hydrolase protein [Xylariaceae sp. FL0016]